MVKVSVLGRGNERRLSRDIVCERNSCRGAPVTSFTVDTKLFRELGELLVAKESTALIELVKNAYDADATVVTVRGTNLNRANIGSIVVEDDGSGMSDVDFERGFLRVAGRAKTSGDRRSKVFGRRFTGEKGIGRLATHKLAKYLKINSYKAADTPRGASELAYASSELIASIDWEKIEALETLDQIPETDALTIETNTLSTRQQHASGTTLVLSPLRKPWTQRVIDSFLREALTLAPLDVLWRALPEQLTDEELLFGEIAVRDQEGSDPGFRIQFLGELAVPDAITPDIAESAGWVAEIGFERSSGLLQVAIAPTVNTIRKYPGSEGFRFEKRLPKRSAPSFKARIFQREGTWDPAVQGIRLFMEGFRVPPYGDPADDWLGVDRAYRTRGHRTLTSLSRLDVADLPAGSETEELSLQGSNAYMGAVFLHRSSTPELEMLVNREGFLPGPGMDFIAEWVRITTDLIVRLGYASRQTIKAGKREDRAIQKASAERADVGESPSALRVRESAVAAVKQLEVARAAIKDHDYKSAATAIVEIRPHIESIRILSDQFGSEAILWRVLASLGTELAAFVHEINALALEVGAIVTDLELALPEIKSTSARSKVRIARKAALSLADRIRRNATYLVDATSFKGRRRRSRLPLRDRFESVLPFFETRLQRKKITLANRIPRGLMTPPMFPSELTGIFTNLMSNAVKFSNENGRIRVFAQKSSGTLAFTIENTGSAVNLRKSAKLFDAFVSTTERPDAVLGQGMGMGLTITRAFVQEYGGDIEFVTPSLGYATALRFSVPAK
jgi:signal transduction histidine kinase